MPGIACRMMSSRLGLVAEVMATESPSQLSPVVIQRTWAVTASVFACSAYAELAITSPLVRSTDSRQPVGDELIHHPATAKATLDQLHLGRIGLHLSDLRRLLAAGQGAQRLHCRDGRSRSHERDQLAL